MTVTLQRISVLAGLVLSLACAAPTSAGGTGQAADRSVVVTYGPGDSIFVGQVNVAATSVVDEVLKRLAELPNEERVVNVKVAMDGDYAPVIRLLDELRARGVQRIGLVTDRRQTDSGDTLRKPEHLVPTSHGIRLEVSLDRRRRASYRVAGQSVSGRRLTSVLRSRLAKASDKAVTIVASDPMGVAWAIECAKNAGATTISLSPDLLQPATPN